MSVTKRLAEIEEGLQEAPSQREKLQYIITLGEELAQEKRADFSDTDKVPGCASDVFVIIGLVDNKVNFKSFTASLVIKGYVAILVHALNDESPENILSSKEAIEKFLKDTGLDVVSLVPSRTNSFSRLYEFILEKTKKLVE